MKDVYTCHVCEGIHSDNDTMSTKCGYCNKRVCTYCTDFDSITNADVCGKCADAVMFNNGNEIDFVTKQKIKSK